MIHREVLTLTATEAVIVAVVESPAQHLKAQFQRWRKEHPEARVLSDPTIALTEDPVKKIATFTLEWRWRGTVWGGSFAP